MNRLGDYVLVERTRTAREGEIIVALVDGSDATLKRFYREGNMIRLQPSNTEMAPSSPPPPASASRARSSASSASTPDLRLTKAASSHRANTSRQTSPLR
ncbi:LexA family protein [Edaphobacter aggregans]|uniref:LexA family protein n=1 Tax=Edaphobacter aggregans TaxID=570835 RepID=UPI001FE100C0|nr:S24 family peptidase [Edaphobacter aggregans]